MIKVAYLYTTGHFSGSAVSLVEVLKTLAGKVDPTIVSPSGSATTFFAQRCESAKVVEVAWLSQFDHTRHGRYRGLRWLIALRELMLFPATWLAIRRFAATAGDIQLIHLNEITGIVGAVMLKRRLGVPLVVHVRAHMGEQSGVRSRLLWQLFDRHVDQIVCIDETVRQTIPPHVRSPVAVVHNALDIAATRRDPRPLPDALSASCGLVRVGIVGSLLRVKGVYDFLAAALKLCARRDDLVFVFVGAAVRRLPGLRGALLARFGLAEDTEQILRDAISLAAMQQRILMTGHREDLENVYRHLDILCFPSHYNAPGRPIFRGGLLRQAEHRGDRRSACRYAGRRRNRTDDPGRRSPRVGRGDRTTRRRPRGATRHGRRRQGARRSQLQPRTQRFRDPAPIRQPTVIRAAPRSSRRRPCGVGVTAPSSRKLVSVQVLRGVAILLVLFFHLTEVGQRYLDVSIGGNYAAFGNAGVDFFFVISGFVVVGVARQLEYSGARGSFSFVYDRAVRIYPIYWIYTLVLIIPFLIDPRLVNTLARMTSVSDYVLSFVLLPNTTPPVLLVGWTLAFEVYFYLVLGLMLLLRVPIAAGLGVWLVALLMCNLRWNHVDPSQFPLLALVSSPLSLEFILGGSASYLLIRRLRPAAAGWMLAAALASIVLLAVTTPLPREDIEPWFRTLRYGPIALVAVIAFVSLEDFLRARRFGWLAAVGDASYSTYLSHTLILSGTGRLLVAYPSREWGSVLALFLGIACLLWGHCSYRYIELPLMRRFRQLKPAPLRKLAS